MEHQELVAIARPIVWRHGNGAGLANEDREDLLQDVLMKYLKRWQNDDAPENIAAWLETTTSNAIVDRFRVDGRRPAHNFAEGEQDPMSLAIAAMRSTQSASEPAVSRELIDSILALIPVEDADLLRRHYVDKDAAAELAADLRISVDNVNQRMTRAKRKLRDALTVRRDLVEELHNPHPHVY